MKYSPTYRTTRRELLKLVGTGAGATLLTPIIDQLAAHAAGDAKATNRQRVVFVVQSNGMNTDHIRPSGVVKQKGDKPANATTNEVALADRDLHKAIEPLTPFKNRLALLQGLSGRIGLSDHSANMGALGCFPKGKPAMMQTIDHAVSDALPAVFKHVGLGLSGQEGASMNYNHSASAPGQACPIICSPDLAFKALFGSVADGAGKTEFNQRSNLLNFMSDDVARTRAGLRGDERAKLDSYLAAYDSLSSRQGSIANMRAKLEKHAPKLGAQQTTTVSSEILAAQFEIGAAALIGGLTNVVTFTSGSGNQSFGSFPEFGIPGLHHIGHGGSYEEKTYEDCFVEIRRFHTKMIAGLAEKLAAVPEGDGTMLDNTLILYLSDSGESHHPRLYEWPVVLLGNLGGKLNTAGRYLELPGYGQQTHRTLASLYCTLLHAVGTPRDHFGVDDTGLKGINQTGVVQDLLA